MAVTLSATIEGEKQLSRELGISADHIKDWRKPFTEIGGELLKTWQLNFDTQGSTLGEQWKPRKDKNPWPLLQKTGAMRKSFYATPQGFDTLVLGNRDSKFPFHQSNSSRSRLPRRVMMKLAEAQRTFIQKAFQAHIVESIRNLKK